MNTPIEKNKNPRRDFLKILGLAVGAAGTVGGASLLNSCTNETGEPGEKVKLLTQDGKLVEVDAKSMTLASDVENEELLTEYQKRGREGIPGKKWVMVIDLARCQNARKCMAACNSAHELRPEMHHINVLEMQNSEDTAPYYMPKPCYHCDNPPCTKVCPVNATFKRKDGIVLIDNERCIGCRFCIAACPYSARMFNWFAPDLTEEQKQRTYDIELNVPQKKGTITKCLFSADRLRVGKLPYCVSACPNGVYYFGDKNEDSVTNGTSGETVRFSDLIRDNAGYTMHEEFGTKPQVFYLPAKDRRVPFEQAKKQTENNENA
ncbi:MAG: 4Fe-4S dicluster domain-containing protein [Bacteroidales bacterium]|nr:4Fe-4S dicluster domain-containing protein [Bacteroidales bacterium]MCF8458149.1 4Fe-4S dicluster domain-containing protein [Bacteroidales bacterium]